MPPLERTGGISIVPRSPSSGDIVGRAVARPTSSDLVRALAARIASPRVLAAIEAVPRDVFVPAGMRHRAWEDTALPLGEGQTISQPTVVARMCELLELCGDETVLDVGTGSGYHAAVLSRLAARVVSIERFASLNARARANLEAAGIANVTLLVGDGAAGAPGHAPFDAINVAAASAAGVPPALPAQLADGGRLVVPVGRQRQRLVVMRRRGEDFEHRALDDVRFVPLVGGD